jgi:hypothetical protein
VERSPRVPEELKLWIERAYLFIGTTSFLLTFGLPWSILKLQMKRLDAEIEKRRADAGIGKHKADDD